MQNDKFKKGINDLKMIKMTKAEKSAMLSSILNDRQNVRAIKSPFSFSLWLHRPIMRNSFVVALLLIVFGGGIFGSAERSLPGSGLYSVKVRVSEPLRGMIKSSPVDQANWQASRVEKRLSEAEQLAKSGHLTESANVEIIGLISEHSDKLAEALTEIDGQNPAASEMSLMSSPANDQAPMVQSFSTKRSADIEPTSMQDSNLKARSFDSTIAGSSEDDSLRSKISNALNLSADRLEVIANENIATSTEYLRIKQIVDEVRIRSGQLGGFGR